ncbi:TonB-dependent siderophore receptor [uncultured Dialister sp.]|mgnify:CR=1 FL=1|jgi:vitamin B12 transporter|uniref:TonB-dependent receptor plug domain-containing protein n=1 Tax=uncultured Dialister sp. TaxID=278064 RepID=UPI0025F80747|nr:TonB-dependent receptor [uncultured Dialister sp.]
MMNRKFSAALLAVFALTGSAFSVEAADGPVYSLEGIVVTASRVPEKKIDSNADVSVVTSKEIAEKHYDDVSEAIRHVPGVNIASHGMSGQTSNSDQIYINGSKNVVVLVDGMRQNSNGNTLQNVDLSSLTNMDAIDHIEVLKGSASTLYGSDAQGGVINIITKTPKENKVSTTLRASVGNFGRENYTFYNEGRQDNFFWTLEAGKELMGKYKDGWGRRVVNHLNADHYNVKLGYDLGNDSNLVFRYEKYKSNYIMPNTGTNDSTESHGKKDNDSTSFQYKAKINDRLDNLFSVYRNNTTFDVPMQWFNMKMRTSGISDQLTYRMDRQTLTGGMDWYEDEIRDYPSEPELTGAKVHNLAFYLQDKIDITDKWNITPGVRYDHNSQFGSRTSPSLSIGYKQSENTNYYINYKTFFVAPNLYQQDVYSEMDYGNTKYLTKGNKDLKPETGYTVEIGASHKFDDTMAGTVNFFHTHAKNMITNSSLWDESTNTSIYTWNNMDKASVNGFNLSLNKDFSKHWSADIGYSYLHINAAKGENINNNGRLPESVLNVGVHYRADRFDASLDGRGVMNRYGMKAHPEMRDYGNYWVWDLAANYHFTKGATLFARLNNIFDQFYTDVGSSYDPYGSNWYSAPGRNFEVGLQYQF